MEKVIRDLNKELRLAKHEALMVEEDIAYKAEQLKKRQAQYASEARPASHASMG